jgi:trigger factor
MEEKIIFNVAKVFSAEDIEKHFHVDATVAKKFKSDIEFTLSGCSHITPHEVNEELFSMVFPGEEFKDESAFRKRLQKEVEKSNEEQCKILYVNHVRKALMDQFDAPLPEIFLKRWILTRGAKDVTAESIDAEWNEKYVPSIKWEVLDSELSKIKTLNPTHNEVVDYIKEILKTNDHPVEGESDKEKEDRIEKAAQSIASDSNNNRQIIDRLYVSKTFDLLKEQLNPETEKVTMKEFAERANQ